MTRDGVDYTHLEGNRTQFGAFAADFEEQKKS
jgi:hypothetical protein